MIILTVLLPAIIRLGHLLTLMIIEKLYYTVSEM